MKFLILVIVLAEVFGIITAEKKCAGLTGDYLTNCTANPDNFNVVEAPIGPIGGLCSASLAAGRSFCLYKGIRYGKPPIGKLRMRNPVKPAPWNTTFWALEHSEFCIQYVVPGIAVGSEDCLFLNVYVPQGICTKDNRCPVMVNVPAGGFHLESGNSDQYGADRFMREDAIVISMNYRLNVMGFSNTQGDQSIQGNAGLMDIVLSLRWVQDNIRAFGGEPGHVTIFGNGAALGYLCYAEFTRGLFSGVILQSLSALSGWTFQPKPTEALMDLARRLNITYDSIPDLAAKIRATPAADLLVKVEDMTNEAHIPIKLKNPYPFAPSVDDFMPALVAAFAIEFSDLIIQSGDKKVCHGVNVLSGISSFEGGFGKQDFLVNPNLLNDIANNNELLVPSTCRVPKGSPTSIKIGKKLFDFYFTAGLTLQNYFRYFGMVLSISGNIEFTRYNFLNGAKAYMYYFKYCSLTNYGRRVYFPNETCGVDSGPVLHDDIPLIFSQDDIIPLLREYPNNVTVIRYQDRTDDDRLLSEKMVRSFVNFARTGTPNGCNSVDPLIGVEWKPVTDFYDLQVMNLDTTLSMGPHPYQKDINFWKTVCEV